jgi:hypothetical protein
VPDFTPAFGEDFGFPLLHGGCGDDQIDSRLPCLADVQSISADAVSDGGLEAHGVGRALQECWKPDVPKTTTLPPLH